MIKKKIFKINNIKYIKSVTNVLDLGSEDLPEVAFLGCSNVGKSSLINSLTSSRKMAHVSKTPGKTQTLNLFVIDNALNVVDTPGYGYAKVPLKTINLWDKMMYSYFKKRANLKRAFVLVNAHIGYKKSDLIVFQLLERCNVPYQIVLTKKDKLKKSELDDMLQNFRQISELKCHDNIIITSSSNNEGILELKNEIYNFIL